MSVEAADIATRPAVMAVPFEKLAGPYQVECDERGLFCRLQTDARHRGVDDLVDAAAMLAFADFAMFVFANHASEDRYADRRARGTETIVTASFGADIISLPAIGEELVARGAVTRDDHRRLLVEGMIDSDGQPLLSFHGIWVRTKLTADPIGDEFDANNAQTSSAAKDFLSLIGPLQSDGDGALSLVIEPRHCNLLGIAHGGLLLSLVALGHRTKMPAVTLRSVTLDFYSPAHARADVAVMFSDLGTQRRATRGRLRCGNLDIARFNANCEPQDV